MAQPNKLRLNIRNKVTLTLSFEKIIGEKNVIEISETSVQELLPSYNTESFMIDTYYASNYNEAESYVVRPGAA